MSMPLSHFVLAYPSPSPCPQVHSLRLRSYSCPAPRFLRTIFFFRFHIYMLAYGIYFSLSDVLHSVWQTLGPPTSLPITQFCFFPLALEPLLLLEERGKLRIAHWTPKEDERKVTQSFYHSWAGLRSANSQVCEQAYLTLAELPSVSQTRSNNHRMCEQTHLR